MADSRLVSDWLPQKIVARAMLLPEPPKPGMPIFMEHSPQTICDQILWLVKNANLDFQVKETPFSLNLSLKKKFIEHWNTSHFHHQQNQGLFTPEASYTTAPMFSQTRSSPETLQDTGPQNSPQPLDEINNFKDIISDMKIEKEVLEKEVVVCELRHKKLVKENKEIQSKHEKVCHELKNIKNENETVSKECKRFSVALESCKKNLKDDKNFYDEKLKNCRHEISKLNDFKEDKIAEEKKSRKAEKKARQKHQKETESKEKPVEK